MHKTSYTNEYDVMRTRFLAENRIRVLRFDNKVIYKNVEGIIEAIKGAVQTTPNPSSLGFAACYRRDART